MEDEIPLPTNPDIDKDSVSPVKEGVDQTLLNTDTYYPRETGRHSNRIYEYVYWNLRAEQEGKIFKCYYKNFKPFGTEVVTRIPKRPIRDRGIRHISPYPFHHIYYKDHREDIRKMLNYKDLPLKYDVVIHLRLDDILNKCTSYTLLAFSEYVMLLKTLPVPDNIIIIGNATEEVHYQYVDCLKMSLKGLYKRRDTQVEIIKSLGNSIQEDYDIISSCKTLIASTSTFWYWSAFLSNNVKKIYYPDFGVSGDMKLELEPEKCEMFAKLTYPKKIEREDLHRIFL